MLDLQIPAVRIPAPLTPLELKPALTPEDTLKALRLEANRAWRKITGQRGNPGVMKLRNCLMASIYYSRKNELDQVTLAQNMGADQEQMKLIRRIWAYQRAAARPIEEYLTALTEGQQEESDERFWFAQARIGDYTDRVGKKGDYTQVQGEGEAGEGEAGQAPVERGENGVGVEDE